MQTIPLFDPVALVESSRTLASQVKDADPKTPFLVSQEANAVEISNEIEQPSALVLIENKAMPSEHTLSSDEKWSYPGGNFGIRLALNILDDPRIRRLNPKTLGTLTLLRAFWEAGRPISAKSSLACRDLGLTKAAWANCMDELTETNPALIEIRQGLVLPTSYGKPIQKGLSQVRALAAQARHEKVKNDGGVVREPEVLAQPAPESSNVAATAGQVDLFGGTPEVEKIPDCPYAEIMALFVSTCESLPKPLDAKNWPGTRKKRVGDIWKKNPTLEFWQILFSDVEKSDFLCGRRAGINFKATFDWIIHQPNMIKIQEGNFRSNGKPNMFQGGQFGVGTYGTHDIDQTASWLQDK